MPEQDDRIARATSYLRASRHPIALTGAGVSADSGIPTFRDAGGLWRGRRPEDLATPEAFQRDPRTVWAFYSWRRARARECRPNPAHYALSALEKTHPELFVVTQNVDGFHRLAGSTRVVELHGNLFRDRCFDCGSERDAVPEDEGDRDPPRCPACGGRYRPGVVWFGEPVTEIGRAFDLASRADLVLVAGTSGVVEPAASVARVARERGSRVIEVNPNESALSAIADVSLRGRAAEILPQLVSPGLGPQ